MFVTKIGTFAFDEFAELFGFAQVPPEGFHKIPCIVNTPLKESGLKTKSVRVYIEREEIRNVLRLYASARFLEKLKMGTNAPIVNM